MKKILIMALIASSFSASALVTNASPNTPIGPFGAVADCTGADGAGGFSDTVAFTEIGTISDMDVTVDITHTWRSDIQMDIFYDGSTVILAAGQGGQDDNYLGTFDDEAGAACDGSAAGPCTPQESLTAFDGSTTPGSIQLNVCDAAGGDSGTLNAWSVSLQGQPGDELPVELMNLSID